MDCPPLAVVWTDRSGSTIHVFDDTGEAAEWLWGVLGEYITADELGKRGLPHDGIGALCHYADEGYDDVGRFEVFVRGQRISTNDLLLLAEDEGPPTPTASASPPM